MAMYLPSRKQIDHFAKCVVLCAIAGILLWALTSDLRTAQPFTFDSQPLEGVWAQQLGDETIALDSLNDVQIGAAGEALVLCTTLPDLFEDKVLFFYTKDVEVAVYLDDVLVYEFTMADDFAFLQTPGNTWHTVALSTQNSGQTLRLVLHSAFENRYETTLSTLYFAYPNETVGILLSREGLRIIMSVILFIMAIIAYVDTFLWNRKNFKRFFFEIGNLYLAAALWLFGMYGYLDYFFHQPILSYLLSMLMAIFIPAAVYEFIKNLYPPKNFLFISLGYLVWGNVALQLVLQFVFGISLLTLLPLTAFVYALGSFCCIVLLARVHLPKHRPTEKTPLRFALSSAIFIFFGALGEIGVMITLPERTDLLGVSSIGGLILYLIVNQFAITRMESNIDVEKLLIEENYNKLQNTSLIQQIKAHFFFNTLNNISALCKSNPAEADHAINLLAQYMRSYMHLIDKQENIPLAQELLLVEASLGIEKMRFPAQFDYRLQLESTNFFVPPLCVQPLVENACCHGLRGRHANGLLTVCSKQTADAALIIVSDNGTGFDTDLLKESCNIGLNNLEKRIRLMANGTMQIESTIGQGTTITLTFPIEPAQE